MNNSRSFYFSDGPYIQMLKALVGALTLPEAFVKLLGNPHTGKSALCAKLTQYLRRKGVKVIHFDTAIESPDMLRAALAKEFDLPLSSNFARILEDALQQQNQKRVILVFDDAHLLTDITLIEIYRLAEVQVNEKRLLNILLCGEPGLEKRLLSNREFKSLLLNVSHKFKLEPMNDEELGQFFYRYVDKAGMPGLQLEQSAMSYLFKLCKGYPGPAANMCQLIVAARINSAELHPVTKTELVSIFSSANGEQALPSAGFRYSNKMSSLIPFAAVVLIVSVGLLFRQLNQPSDGAVLEVAEQAVAANSVDSVSPFQDDEVIATPRASVSEVTAVAANTEELPVQVVAPIDTGDIEPELDSTPTAVGTVGTIGTRPVSGASTVQLAPPEEATASVSDSGLALVTAEERGIDLAAIVEPEFDGAPQTQTVETTEEGIEAGIEANSEARRESGREESTTDSNAERVQETVQTVAQTQAVSPEQTDASQDVLLPNRSSNSGLEQEAAREIASRDEAVAVGSGDTELAAVRTETEAAPEVGPTASAPVLADGNNESNIETGASSELDLEVLQQFVASWVDAWQSQSLESYFAAYHAEFEPRYQDSVPAWRSSRERVIGNAGWIELELSDFQYIGEEAGVVEVHFWLNYRSPTYQDETQKKLLLSQEAGAWRILEEINLQVRS